MNSYIIRVTGSRKTLCFIIPGKEEWAADWRADGLEISDTDQVFGFSNDPLYDLMVRGDRFTWEFEINLTDAEAAKIYEAGIMIERIDEKYQLSFGRGFSKEDLN